LTPVTPTDRVPAVQEDDPSDRLELERRFASDQACRQDRFKLRRPMVRPGRDRLRGRVELDETCVGGAEEGVIGRLMHNKALVLVAVQEDGRGRQYAAAEGASGGIALEALAAGHASRSGAGGTRR